MIGERSGNQKMECTLEETEIVVLFSGPDVLNLYRHASEHVQAVGFNDKALDSWIHEPCEHCNIAVTHSGILLVYTARTRQCHVEANESR